MSDQAMQAVHAQRGVRLTDLDRGLVYRIGYARQRRRWEVLGPEEPGSDSRDAGATSAPAAKRSADGAPATGPRHAASGALG
jgi:hypothetical protein